MKPDKQLAQVPDIARGILETLKKLNFDKKVEFFSLCCPQSTEMEFKEFEPRFKSTKTRFKLNAGLNLETFDTILSGTYYI